ncbi:hypothetical protein KAR91_57415 [Candidatus Pacearchaeota archaeon]|nr:hypothetical protein [Candidatus Pacearchaeota archaeon]
MSERIITKKCWDCNQTKPLPEFYRDRRAKDGSQSRCKECRKAYDQSKKFKEVCQCYQQSEKGKARWRRYRNSFPEKIKARNIVNHAIKAGKLPRPNSLKCKCSKQARQYHHPDYSKPLEVIPMCIKCHREIHLNSR